jgi:hypothetical protein
VRAAEEAEGPAAIAGNGVTLQVKTRAMAILYARRGLADPRTESSNDPKEPTDKFARRFVKR